MAQNEAYARNRNDASLSPADKTLPSAASTTVNQASVDLGDNSDAVLTEGLEIRISVPALDGTALPNSETTTFDVEDSADDSTFADLLKGVLIVTGAGGTGSAAANQRVRLPSTCDRYIRVTATTSSSTGDQSAVSYTTKVLG